MCARKVVGRLLTKQLLQAASSGTAAERVGCCGAERAIFCFLVSSLAEGTSVNMASTTVIVKHLIGKGWNGVTNADARKGNTVLAAGAFQLSRTTYSKLDFPAEARWAEHLTRSTVVSTVTDAMMKDPSQKLTDFRVSVASMSAWDLYGYLYDEGIVPLLDDSTFAVFAELQQDRLQNAAGTSVSSRPPVFVWAVPSVQRHETPGGSPAAAASTTTTPNNKRRTPTATSPRSPTNEHDDASVISAALASAAGEHNAGRATVGADSDDAYASIWSRLTHGGRGGLDSYKLDTLCGCPLPPSSRAEHTQYVVRCGEDGDSWYGMVGDGEFAKAIQTSSCSSSSSASASSSSSSAAADAAKPRPTPQSLAAIQAGIVQWWEAYDWDGAGGSQIQLEQTPASEWWETANVEADLVIVMTILPAPGSSTLRNTIHDLLDPSTRYGVSFPNAGKRARVCLCAETVGSATSAVKTLATSPRVTILEARVSVRLKFPVVVKVTLPHYNTSTFFAVVAAASPPPGDDDGDAVARVVHVDDKGFVFADAAALGLHSRSSTAQNTFIDMMVAARGFRAGCRKCGTVRQIKLFDTGVEPCLYVTKEDYVLDLPTMHLSHRAWALQLTSNQWVLVVSLAQDCRRLREGHME